VHASKLAPVLSAECLGSGRFDLLLELLHKIVSDGPARLFQIRVGIVSCRVDQPLAVNAVFSDKNLSAS